MMNIGIVVNGANHLVGSPEQSYASIVKLAGLDPNHVWTITYRGRRVGDLRREGMLTPSKPVEVESGMVFNVVHTGNA